MAHAFGFVSFEKLLSFVSVQAAFTEMFAFVVPVLVVQESV